MITLGIFLSPTISPTIYANIMVTDINLNIYNFVIVSNKMIKNDKKSSDLFLGGEYDVLVRLFNGLGILVLARHSATSFFLHGSKAI